MTEGIRRALTRGGRARACGLFVLGMLVPACSLRLRRLWLCWSGICRFMGYTRK